MVDSPKTDPPKIDYTSSFYLGPQDRPGDFITPIRLRLDNFNDWSHAVMVALSSRRKFGFLDGTIKDITPPATKEDWTTIHYMLVSWLTNTIDPEVKSMLSNYDNAKRLWDDLHERFCVINGPRIQQLKAEINRCEQSKTMPISVYFSKLNVLWDELDKHEPLISCECGKCVCNIGKKHADRREGDRLQQFLLGLCSDLYAATRSTLLSQDPLPSINRAYQTISQEERVRGITRIKEAKPEVTGFAVRMEPKLKPRLDKIDKATLVYSHCRKQGHDISTCFEVHGVPEWYVAKYGKPDNKLVARGKADGTSTRGRGVVKANATSMTINPNTPAGSSTTPDFPGFTAVQWQALMAAFGTPNPQTNRLNGPINEGDDWNG